MSPQVKLLRAIKMLLKNVNPKKKQRNVRENSLMLLQCKRSYKTLRTVWFKFHHNT